MDYELSIDPLVICRCCLAEHPALKTVFCNEIVNGSILPFPNVFECVTGFKVTKDDGFPEKLCPVCRQTINDSYVLQQKCKSNRLLLSGILHIELNDVATDKPRVYVSATTQTIAPQSGDNRGTQTDEPVPEQPISPAVPTVSTRSTSMQTTPVFTESAVTQTDRPDSVRKQTQTDGAHSLAAQTQTVPVELRSSDTQTSFEAIESRGDTIEDILEGEMYTLHGDEELTAAADANPIIIQIQQSEHEDQHHLDDEHSVGTMVDDRQQITDVRDSDVDMDSNEGVFVEYLLEELPTPLAAATDTIILVDDASSIEEYHACVNCNAEFTSADDCTNHVASGECMRPATANTTTTNTTTTTTTAIKRPRSLAPRKAPALTRAPRKRPRTTSSNGGGGGSSSHSFTCSLCSYNAKSDRDLGTHVHGHKRSLSTLLDSVYYFRCGGCNAVFLTANDVDDHRGQQTTCSRPDDDGTGGVCTDYQFLDDDDWLPADCDGELDLEDPRLLDVPQRLCSVARTDEGRFRCDRCDEYDGGSATDVWQHYGEVHVQQQQQQMLAGNEEEESGDDPMRAEFAHSFGMVHKCGYCEKAFRSIRSAIAHVFFHASQFVCPYDGCAESYVRYVQLGQHMERQHLPAEAGRGFECSYCAQQYEVFTDYRTHLRTECSGRQHVCDLCDKRFFTKYNLQVHNKYHQNERRYKCQYCEKRFTQSGDMTIHERIHTGEKPFKCPFCPKTFRSIGNRRDHVATHDPTSTVTCNECGMNFKSERILRGHMLIHSTEKRFKCTVCAKEFYRRYHLTKHMRQHPLETLGDEELTL